MMGPEVRIMHALLALSLSLVALPTHQDDFRRERGDALRALEGNPAPALDVEGWMNTGGAPLTLESLRGKVVVLDFWGVW
jgi:hypothetical protein